MTKFKKEIEELIENKNKIPDEFWVDAGDTKHQVIWILNRQKPSISRSYDFDEERIGITKEGKILWGFDSGCSCPTPWEGAPYTESTWKTFELDVKTQGFDTDWEDECYKNLQDYLLLIRNDANPLRVLQAHNAEVRRFLMKRVGYENIKNDASVKVLHTDGTSELLDINEDHYVKVKDSSTDREYLLFVPNHLKTCRAAIAWTFDLQESEYNPILET